MAFASLDGGSGDGDEDGAQLAEINMVPLIDVMLVLLIIFMVTAPLLTHSVNVDLPRAASAATVTRPATLELGVDRNGGYFLAGAPVEPAVLRARLAEAGRLPEPPALHVRADRAADYGHVARAMAWAAQAGVTRLGFLTDPSDGE